MIIEIPGCKFRIKGEKLDWQIQYPQKRTNGADTWNGKYFFPSLEFAISKAYELALIESDAEVDISGVADECNKIKTKLVNDVKKALKNASVD